MRLVAKADAVTIYIRVAAAGAMRGYGTAHFGGAQCRECAGYYGGRRQFGRPRRKRKTLSVLGFRAKKQNEPWRGSAGGQRTSAKRSVTLRADTAFPGRPESD